MADVPTRTERDSLGDVAVPADAYWGAQTQRSLEHFDIGRPRDVWGRDVIEALGLVKAAAATANRDLGVLEPHLAGWVATAAEEVVEGTLDAHFPLVAWQTGSGTQTNMNANEVIANRANELAGHPLGTRDPVHPNDHVNRSQSSNDVFPTVMHVCLVLAVHRRLLPALAALADTLSVRGDRFHEVVMVGRTHLQDATPITVGQLFSGWVAQIRDAASQLDAATAGLLPLAIGATAVGTGLNAPEGFGERVATEVSARTGQPFRVAENRFAAIAAHDAVVAHSAALRGVAIALTKVANDIRWLASGPRAGIGELRLPANEPGSSIMPGKVNPTQAEALLMVCAHVVGNDAAVAFAGAQGNFQLHVHKPLLLHDTLDSVDLLASAVTSFDHHCARGLDVDRERIAVHLADDLMLVTALAPHVGYDRAAAIAEDAHDRHLSLRDAALAAGVAGADFDRWVDPIAMTRPDPPRN